MRIRGKAKKQEAQELQKAPGAPEAKADQPVELTSDMADSSANGADAAEAVTTQLPAQEAPTARAAEPTPAPAPPSPAPAARAPSSAPSGGGGGPVGFFRQMWGDDGLAKSERERQAAAEFEAAIRPAKELLMASVPDASSPEEAARRLQDEQPELLPDPEPGFPRDWYYTGDAVAYYQVRKHIGKARASRKNRETWTPPPGLGPQTFELPPSAYGQ